MKIMVIGVGSMGRRRLRDLTYLNRGEVLLFEPDRERSRAMADSFGVRGFSDFEEAAKEQPDVFVISTPPALHETYIRKALERNLHVFAEVPFMMEAKSLEEVAALAPSYKKVLGISHTARYYPPFRLIYDLVQEKAIGNPLYIEYSQGNYLPDWHPYEDYRKYYAGNFNLGGVGWDMLPHEISPMEWWLGPINSVCARLTKLSALEINGPDNHDMLLTFASGARGFFHNDVLERGGVSGRHIRLVGSEGTIEWHQHLSTVRLYQAKTNENEELPFSRASDWDQALAASREMAEILAKQQARTGGTIKKLDDGFTYESCYLREMRHFLDAVEGKYPYSMTDVGQELQTVRVLGAIRESSKKDYEMSVR